MTQADLAHRRGVTQGYLSTVEHGQGEIGSEVLLAIIRGFALLRTSNSGTTRIRYILGL